MAEQIDEPKCYVKEKLQPVLQIISNIAAGDFSNRLDIPEEDDEFTMLFMGINYLQTELSVRFNNEFEIGPIKNHETIDKVIEERESFEKALKISEKRYKILVETSNDMIFTVDLQGNFLYANKAVETHLGYSNKELRDLNGFELVHPDDLEGVLERFGRLPVGESVNDLEYRYKKKDGSYIYILTNAGPIYSNDGKVIAAFGIARNITHPKEMEKELTEARNEFEIRVKERTAELENVNLALQASEDKYRLLLENANEGIVVAQDGMLRYFNPKVREITGYSNQELAIKPFLDLIYPDDRAMAIERHMKRLEGGPPLTTYLLRIITKQGDMRWLEVNGVRISWESRAASLNFVNDITEKRIAEEALKESEEQYRGLFEKSPNAITIVDEKGVVIDCNKSTEDVTGYRKEEIIGKSFEQLMTLDPKDMPKLIQKYAILLSGQEVEPYELEIMRKDGERRWIRVVNSLLKKDHKIVAIQVISEDITERKLAEEKLKQSEERYTALFERSNDAVYTCDFDGNFIDANPTALKMLGYTKVEISSIDFSSLLSKEQLPLAFEKLKEIFETGTQKEITEYRLRRKDSSYLWVESKGSLVYKDGEPIAVQGIARDITARKRAEETLKESEEKFRNLAEKSPNMIFINKMGVIVYANEKCERVMGYMREELCASDFDFLALIAPESRESVKKSFAMHAKGEEIPPCEYTLLTKEGRVIEGILTTKLIRYEGEKAILGIVTDITQRKKAEEALKESETLYSAVVENSEDGIVIIQDGTLTFANNSSLNLLGYHSEEACGGDFLDFIAPHYREMVIKNYTERMEGKNVPNIYQILFLRKDGKTVPVEVNATIINYKGKPADLVFIRDITERKRTEESLIHSEKLAGIGILSSGIAHEINNPLGGIMGYAEVIMDEENPEQVKQYAKEIVKYTERASDIVNWLSRYSRGAKDSDVMDVDLNEILNESLEALKRARNMGDVSIIGDYRKIPTIKGNRSELQQIFVNLLNNAIDALSDGGSVTLTTTADNGLISVRISDNGKGIPKDQITRIFEPFFTTKRVGEGTGLGLYVTSMIVKKHYGQIDVESEVGKGTSFTLKFPKGKDLPQISELKNIYKPGGNA
jgi:PAS domain S-box-containing protein